MAKKIRAATALELAALIKHRIAVTGDPTRGSNLDILATEVLRLEKENEEWRNMEDALLKRVEEFEWLMNRKLVVAENLLRQVVENGCEKNLWENIKRYLK